MDPQQRLEALCKRRDEAQKKVQRLQGRLSAARDDVAAVELECTTRGVKPEQLPSAISKLTKRYEDAAVTFEAEVTAVETTLSTFQEP